MKKIILPLLLVVALFSVYQFMVASPDTKNAVTETIDVYHNNATIDRNPSFIASIVGDSMYISELHLRATWNQAKSGSSPFPLQAYQWFTDDAGDAPFKLLNWTGITFDTTWTKTVYAADSARFQIPQRWLRAYYNAGWTITGGNSAVSGWMDTTAVYYIDVYAKVAGTPQLLKTLTFDGATGHSKDFARCEYEVGYIATGYAEDSAATRPTYLTSAVANMRMRLRSGVNTTAFPMVAGADSMVFVWRNGSGPFSRQAVRLEYTTAGDAGIVPAVQIINTPVSGFFAAGDTIKFNITATSSNGTNLDWRNQPLALGINRIEMVISGPKRDYMRITGLQNIVNAYVVQKYPNAPWSGMPANTTFENPIKAVIKADSLTKFGPGTYTIFVGINRIYGSNLTKIARLDFQIGTATVDPLPMSSATAGQSCATCHGVNGPTDHHGAAGVEDCLPCHTDNMGAPLYQLLHVFHYKDAAYEAPRGDCSPCHINGSENRFTSDADKVCQSCHEKVPYLSAEHQTAIPLYSPVAGLSCNNMNCHVGGSGAFTTIPATHAALEEKYPGGTVVAKKTEVPLTVDGVPDVQWERADSITTASGIKIKFLYNDDYIYTLVSWLDGHRVYPTGVVAPSESIFRRQWTYSGTAWSQSGEEDRLAFAWAMTGAYGAECGRTCHDEAAIHSTGAGLTDVWHWKAQRTNPSTLSDDQYWDATGRKSDASTGSFGTENVASGLPISMGSSTPANNAAYLYQSTAIAFVGTGFVTGDHIPGYIINDAVVPPITGSRGDVSAKGIFNPATGRWTLEMRRALNTTNGDDFVVNLVDGNDFTVARFDNAGSEHARQGVDVGVYHVTYSEEVIPVELTSFTGTTDGNFVSLKWSTATEQNNFGFEIQRKLDGEWEKAGFVEGHGTTTNVSNYTFSEKLSVMGKYSYRLKQVDLDGTAAYSSTIEISVRPADFDLTQNYPNPFNPTTTIDYAVANKGRVMIKIYNIGGEEVATLVNEVKEPGYYTMQFNASNLPSGVYLYRMVSGNFNSVKKMILLK